MFSREHAAEAHVGIGLDVRRPPLPHLQHLLVLASGVGVQGGHFAPEEWADRLRKVCPLPTRWARRRDMLRLPGFLQGKCSLPRTVSLLSKDRGTVSEKKSMGSMPTSVPLEGTLDVSGATEGEGTEGGEDTEGGDEED